MTRSISRWRPMTGSSFFSRACWVRLRPNWSSTSEPEGCSPEPPPVVAPACRRAGRAAGAAVARQELDDLLAHAGQVGAELHEHLGGDALALADQAEEDVLGADVVVAELQRLAEAQLEDLLGAGRERDVPGRRGAALADDLLDLRAHGLERDAERLERLGGDALTLVDQPEQDVLGADVAVVEEASLLLGQDDDSAGPVGEPFEQGSASPRERGIGGWGSENSTALPSDRGPMASSCGRRWDAAGAAHLACGPWPRRGRLADASPPHLADGLGRVHDALLDAVAADDAVPHRDRRPPHQGRRQAPAAGVRHGLGAHRRARRRGRDAASRCSAGWLSSWCTSGSLYHDDVMDEATTRHFVESVNARWGNLQAILAGDYLLAKASEIAAGARHRGGRAAGRHHRPALRGPGRRAAGRLQRRPAPRSATSARSTGKTAALFSTAVPHRRPSSAELPRDQVDALTAFGRVLRHGVPDRRRRARRRRHRRGARQARGPRHGRGHLHAAGPAGPRRPRAATSSRPCSAAPSTTTSACAARDIVRADSAAVGDSLADARRHAADAADHLAALQASDATAWLGATAGALITKVESHLG